MLDPYKIREDFPSIAEDYIFMNNADSTGIPVPVLEKILAYYNEVKSRPGFENTSSYRALEIYEEARGRIFEHFGVVEDSIVFTSSNLQSLLLILQSIDFKKNEVFLISSNAQGGVMSLLKEYVETVRGRLEVVDFEEEGFEEKLKGALVGKSVKAALLNHVSGATGTILQIDKVIPVLKEKGVMTILDASYSAQRIRLTLPKTGVDYAFFKSGNMFSIEGLGILYVSEERRNRVESTPGFFVVKQAEKENCIGVVALAAALEYLNRLGFEDILNHERNLAEEIVNAAAGEGVTFYQSALKELRTGILSLVLDQVPSSLLQTILEDQFHILAESGSFDSPIILNKTGGREVLRLSPTVFNTVEEAKIVGERIAEIRESYVRKTIEKQALKET
ncbi:MAG: aminotransferase class V-fold PLP-dependent enzyme [Crenarchaeota archaeon]|nr:aminotransferase class V-fold PLP-dependent enzyme [Thermoproteota archaeon]